MDLCAVDLFRDLPEDVLNELERGSSMLDCPDETFVFQKGDPADHVYAVLRGPGRVRIGSADDSGKTLMVEVFGEGEVFGELAVLDAGVRTASAVTEGALRLVRVRAPVFLEVLRASPALGAALSHALANRLRRTFSLLENTTFDTVEQRLARQLLYLGDKHGRQMPRGVRLTGRYRQPDLADLLGVTVRTVITVLNGWRKSGIIDYDTSTAYITITDLEKLTAVARARAKESKNVLF